MFLADASTEPLRVLKIVHSWHVDVLRPGRAFSELNLQSKPCRSSSPCRKNEYSQKKL
jgi:hypothetical protein